MAQTSAKFCFPVLSCEKAVVSCRELFPNVTFTEEDLKRPQYQQMRRFYTMVLTELIGVPHEQFTQPQFSQMSAFEHPELHDDSANLMTLTLALQRFMFACGVEKFTIMDIVAPKPKHTLVCVRYLSSSQTTKDNKPRTKLLDFVYHAILNFVMFKESCAFLFDNAVAEVSAAAEQRQQLTAKRQELQQKIGKWRDKRAEEEYRVKQVAPEVEELQSSVNELNKEQAAEIKHINQIKTTNAELNSKKAELKVNLATLKADNENLKSKIVQSPERFKGEITRLSSAVQSLKIAKEDRTVRLQELCDQQESRLQYTEYVQNALKMICAIGDGIEKQREAITKQEELQDRNMAQKELLRDLTAKVQQLRRQMASKQEKLSRIARQHDKKITATNDVVEHSKREHLLVQKKMQETRELIQKIEEQRQSILQKCQEKENIHQQEREAMHQAYQQLLEQVNGYHSLLSRGWEKVLKGVENTHKD